MDEQDDNDDPINEGIPADSVRSADDRPPKEKVRDFPDTPGVYLMKDERGRVLYIGKAKSLRHRAASYFTDAALQDRRVADMIPLIADIDYLDAESEVDALLLEARLIKDIQPRFNVDLKDDKSSPTCKSSPMKSSHASNSRVSPPTKGSSSTAPSPMPAPFAEPSRSSSESSSSGLVRLIFSPTIPSGSTIVPVSSTTSSSAPPPATCGSPRKTTRKTSRGCVFFSMAKGKSFSRK